MSLNERAGQGLVTVGGFSSRLKPPVSPDGRFSLRGLWRKALALMGPAWLVAVGYMDPGNWGTDIAAGAAFGYQLLFVVLASSAMAMVLQILSVRLGLVLDRDLARACRDYYPRPVALALWLLAELAIVACDLAEVVGTAIALNLLFGVPLLLGVGLTVLDVLVVLALQRHGLGGLQAAVCALILLALACLLFQLILAQPSMAEVAAGLIPRSDVLHQPGMLYLAMGIIGATVMPHNLYLHSAIVRGAAASRRPILYGNAPAAAVPAALQHTPRRPATEMRGHLRRFSRDTVVALSLAFFINAAILVLAGALFHGSGHGDVADIESAHGLLGLLLGVPVAGTAFAVALLATGQSSSLTATLAGQVVMEGFLGARMSPWRMRLITRALAVVPAIAVVALMGDNSTGGLLIFSQIILSMQLPFALVPLVQFTSNRKLMGAHVSPPWLIAVAVGIALLLIALNLKLLIDLLG